MWQDIVKWYKNKKIKKWKENGRRNLKYITGSINIRDLGSDKYGVFPVNSYTIQKNEIEDKRHLYLAFIPLSTTVEPLELTVWNNEKETA